MVRTTSVAICALVCFAALASSGASQQRRPIKLDKGGEPYPETATSFDCKKATLRVEQMICADRSLAMQDGTLGETFWFLKRELAPTQIGAVLQSQHAWIGRRNSCANRECVERAYDQRLKELWRISEARAKYLRRNVSRIGQCETAKIEWIGPRLQLTEGDPPTGTSAILDDGVSLVSYDRVAAILSSRIGDPARVCLVSVPRGCPPGDNRGRVYHVTDLRTGGQWQLPDAEHGCGGA